MNIFAGFGHVLEEVALALTPLLLFFIFFQVLFLKLPLNKVWDVMKGMILTFLGLSFFLQGVNIGFLPAGEAIGNILGSAKNNWIVIPIGFLLGFVATFAEPAVKVLNSQVEKVSGGYIPQKVMLITLSIGVAVSIALSMLRIIVGFSIWYYIIPGYILILTLMFFTSKTFAAVAFDSGGVATGPMSVTFISAMSIGIASAIDGRDPLLEGFGMISIIALAPVLSVLILGLLYRRGEAKDERELESES